MILHLTFLLLSILMKYANVSPGGRIAPPSPCPAANVLCVPEEYESIQDAADAAQAGQTVSVGRGTWDAFQTKRNGTASAPITYQSRSRYAAAILTPVNFSSFYVGIMNRYDYNTIDGFRVDFSSSVATNEEHAIACLGGSGVDPNWQVGCVIRHCATFASYKANIFSGHSTGILIEDNEASSSDEHGIYVSNSADNPIIRRNRTYANKSSGIHINGDIDQPPGDGIISGALVDSNLIFSNVGTGGSAALSMDGVQDSTISNNLIFGNPVGGGSNVGQQIAAFCCDGGEAAKNLHIINNTVVSNTTSSNGIPLQIKNGDGGSCPCATTVLDQGGHVIFNNILFPAVGNTWGSYKIASTNFSSFYNDIFDKITVAGTAYTSLGAMQAAGYEAASVVATAAGTLSGYHLLPGATALNAGVSSFQSVAAPLIDLEGISRPQGAGYDIGCYEP